MKKKIKNAIRLSEAVKPNLDPTLQQTLNIACIKYHVHGDDINQPLARILFLEISYKAIEIGMPFLKRDFILLLKSKFNYEDWKLQTIMNWI